MTIQDINQADFLQELKEIEAESMGWLPLEQGAYLHVDNPNDEEVITVVGVPDASMAGMNVLLLGW